MNSRSSARILLTILSDIFNEIIEAIGATSLASVYYLYTGFIEDCDSDNHSDLCNQEILENKLIIALAVTYFTFIRHLVRTFKPETQQHFLSKLWDGIVYTAEMHEFLLDYFIYLHTLIKVGHVAISDDDHEFYHVKLSQIEFILAATLTGSLALLSNSELRNYRSNNNQIRSLSTKIVDGLFGSIEGLAAGQELVSSFQYIFNTFSRRTTSIYNPISIGLLFGLGGTYASVLTVLYVQHAPPEVTDTIFSRRFRPVARALSISRNLLFAFVFGISLILDLNDDSSAHRTEHFIEFSVLLAIYILKSLLVNCCWTDRLILADESAGNDNASDIIYTEGSGYISADFSDFLDDFADSDIDNPTSYHEIDEPITETVMPAHPSSTASLLLSLAPDQTQTVSQHAVDQPLPKTSKNISDLSKLFHSHMRQQVSDSNTLTWRTTNRLT